MVLKNLCSCGSGKPYSRCCFSRLLAFIVILLTLLAFLPSLDNKFVVWDDDKNFLLNSSHLGFGWRNVRWMFFSLHLGVFQPLSWMMWAMDYKVWGLNSFGFHFSNIILHAANAGLVYLVSKRLITEAIRDPAQRPEPLFSFSAALATLLFSLHPLRVEAVSWASNGSYLLPAFFALLSILFYCIGQDVSDQENSHSQRWFSGSVAAYAFSLLSKPVYMPLPFVFMVLDIYPLRRMEKNQAGFGAAGWIKLWKEKLPFFVLLIPAAIISVHAKASLGGLLSIQEMKIWQRPLVSLYTPTFYLWKTIVPLGLLPLYPLARRIDLMQPQYILSALVTLAITVTVILNRRRWPGACAAWVCYLLILAPVIGIMPYGAHIVADKWSYLPIINLYIVGAAIFMKLCNRVVQGPNRRIVAIGFTALSALCLIQSSLMAWEQQMVWRNSFSLWSRVLELNPDSFLAQVNFAYALNEENKLDEASGRLRQYLKADIDFEHRLEWSNLRVSMLLSRRRFGDAAEASREIIKIDPDTAENYSNLGLALLGQGDTAGARRQFERALSLTKDKADKDHLRKVIKKLQLSISSRASKWEIICVASLKGYDCQCHLSSQGVR